MPQTVQASPAHSAPTLEASALALMSALRDALAGLFSHLPDPVTRAVDLEHALGLDKTFAWQVFRLSQSSDFAEVANIPSRAGARRLVEAARRRRIPSPAIKRLVASLEDLDEFAALHCGDRSGLISMLSGFSAEAGEQIDLRIRRTLFRSQAHVWGVQAQVQARTLIFHVAPGSDLESNALVCGDIGLQRVRSAEPLSVISWSNTTADPAPGDDAPPSSPAPTPAPRLSILPEFCTQPLPSTICRAGLNSAPETELLVPPGRTGAVTLYRAHVVPAAVRGPQTVHGGKILFTIPVEVCNYDVMIPVGMSDPASPRAAVYGRRHHPDLAFEERRCDLLSQREVVTHLGEFDAPPPVAGAPRHADAVAHVLHSQGWMNTRFDVYRCRVEYPAMHTLLAIRIASAS